MVRPSQTQRNAYQPSILDRLVDTSLATGREDWYSKLEFIESVQRDIEDLLNARQTVDDISHHPALRDSIIGFGLPDSSNFELDSPTGKRLFSRVIENVIRVHEPRVRQVRVTLLEQPANAQNIKHVRFQIDLALHLKDSLTLSFESTMRLGSGHFKLSQGTHVSH